MVDGGCDAASHAKPVPIELVIKRDTAQRMSTVCVSGKRRKLKKKGNSFTPMKRRYIENLVLSGILTNSSLSTFE